VPQDVNTSNNSRKICVPICFFILHITIYK
jgi:hypothetical protein